MAASTVALRIGFGDQRRAPWRPVARELERKMLDAFDCVAREHGNFSRHFLWMPSAMTSVPMPSPGIAAML